MEYAVFIILLLLCSVLCYKLGQRYVHHQEQLNNDKVLAERDKILSEITRQQEHIGSLKREYDGTQQMIQDARKAAQDASEAEVSARKEKLKALDVEYDYQVKALKDKYLEEQKEYLRSAQEMKDRVQEDIDIITAELEKMKATRSAAIEAARKEKTVSDSPELYQIQLAADEVHDIDYLEGIKDKLSHPEILGKYIWSVFFQKKFKSFCANILGQDSVCGIYKITDQLTKEAYIGRAVDVSKRWSEHIKCGCGATPTSSANQLYAAMRRDGIENFSFELLERCLSEELDEKERFFIDLYSADTVGLNSKKGNQ